jgi:hypothetical protein
MYPLWCESDWPRTLANAEYEGGGDRYSVITITQRYIFASQNASSVWRELIAFYSYRSRLMEIVEIVIASYSYRSGLIENIIAFYSYRS